jgi:hypothetical protein
MTCGEGSMKGDTNYFTLERAKEVAKQMAITEKGKICVVMNKKNKRHYAFFEEAYKTVKKEFKLIEKI